MMDWYQKRKITVSIAIAYKCFLYFEYWSIAISGIYYYKNTFKISNPKFYYGCSVGVIFLSGIISSYICGQIMDRARNLRRLISTLVLFSILGNLTYTMTWSPWLPVLGRSICGFSIGIMTVTAGKILQINFSSLINPKGWVREEKFDKLIFKPNTIRSKGMGRIYHVAVLVP